MTGTWDFGFAYPGLVSQLNSYFLSVCRCTHKVGIHGSESQLRQSMGLWMIKVILKEKLWSKRWDRWNIECWMHKVMSLSLLKVYKLILTHIEATALKAKVQSIHTKQLKRTEANLKEVWGEKVTVTRKSNKIIWHCLEYLAVLGVNLPIDLNKKDLQKRET